MRIVGIVGDDPVLKGLAEGEGIIPVVSPNQILFERTHDTFSIGIAFRVGPSCEDLFESNKRTIHHEALAGGLAAVV